MDGIWFEIGGGASAFLHCGLHPVAEADLVSGLGRGGRFGWRWQGKWSSAPY
jgi:hypothetical protein